MLAAGDVLLVDCQKLKDPHDKFTVCVCPDRKWFFFINSKPRAMSPEAQVPVRDYELDCLDHDSWIDTSKIIRFSEAELVHAKRDRQRHKGPLSNAIKLRIKKKIGEHGVLTEEQVRVVKENL